MVWLLLIHLGLAQGPVGGTNLIDGDLVDFAPGDEAFVVTQENGTYESILRHRLLLEAKAPDYAYLVRGVYRKPWYKTDQEFPPRKDGESQPIYQDVDEIFVSRSGSEALTPRLWKKSYVHEEVRYAAIEGSYGLSQMQVDVFSCEKSEIVDWDRNRDDPRKCHLWLPGDTSEKEIEDLTRYLFLQLPHQTQFQVDKRLALLNTDLKTRDELTEIVPLVLGDIYERFCSKTQGELKSYLASPEGSSEYAEVMEYLSYNYPGGQAHWTDKLPIGEPRRRYVRGRTEWESYELEQRRSPILKRVSRIRMDFPELLARARYGLEYGYSTKAHSHWKKTGLRGIGKYCAEMSEPLLQSLILGETEDEYLMKRTSEMAGLIHSQTSESAGSRAEAQIKPVAGAALDLEASTTREGR